MENMMGRNNKGFKEYLEKRVILAEEVGHIGDVNWAEYGGGPVYRRAPESGGQTDIYGDCFLVYVEPPTDDVEFSDPDARWTVYSIELDPEIPDWADLKAVGETMDMTVKDLKADFTSTDPLHRALAYESVASYYGWENFDGYPRQLTCAEMNKEFDAGIYCGEEDEDDEDEASEMREGRVSEPNDARDILEGLGPYMKHEGHDAPRESARIARMIAGVRGNSDKADKVLEEVDRLVAGNGVEPIRDENANDRYYGDVVALYVNMGDTYETTLLYDTEAHEFHVTSWGDWYEAYEAEQEEEPEEDEEEEEEEEDE